MILPSLGILEGESLLNDATGPVLYRLTVVAALTGAFSSAAAAGSFLFLSTGGVILGVACGFFASAQSASFLDFSTCAMPLMARVPIPLLRIGNGRT